MKKKHEMKCMRDKVEDGLIGVGVRMVYGEVMLDGVWLKRGLVWSRANGL